MKNYYINRLHKMCILTPADYERTVRQLTFSPTVDVNAVPVNIINDDIHEDNERFFGNLTVDTDQQTILNPDTAVVTILDDIDCKLFKWQCLYQIILCYFHIYSYYNWI